MFRVFVNRRDHQPVNMANPLQALGNMLQGKQPGTQTSKDIFEAVHNDDAAAVEQFLSRGVRINDLSQVQSCFRVPTRGAGPAVSVVNSAQRHIE